MMKTTQCRQIVITAFLVLANLVQMMVNFAGIVGGSLLSESMGVKEYRASWITASHVITQGTFVLVNGRLGDVFGHRELLLAGSLWLSICTLACAFCHNFIEFITLRAPAGLCGAFIKPDAVAMIASTNPPGCMRNLSLGLFASSTPTGGYFGALFLGAFVKRTEWKWVFVFIACLGLVVFALICGLSLKKSSVDQEGKIDWIGSALGTSLLILFNFLWKLVLGYPPKLPQLTENQSQASSVGWSTPYKIVLLILSIILFCGFLFWEKHFASHPIMPFNIFKAPSILTLLLVIFLNYMAISTLIWYQVLWFQKVLHCSPLHFAVAWTPFIICATGAAVLAAWLIPCLAAQWILAMEQP